MPQTKSRKIPLPDNSPPVFTELSGVAKRWNGNCVGWDLSGFVPNRVPPVEVPEVLPLGDLCGLDAVVLLIELEQHVGGKLVPVHGALPRHVYLIKQLEILKNTEGARHTSTKLPHNIYRLLHSYSQYAVGLYWHTWQYGRFRDCQ